MIAGSILLPVYGRHPAAITRWPQLALSGATCSWNGFHDTFCIGRFL